MTDTVSGSAFYKFCTLLPVYLLILPIAIPVSLAIDFVTPDIEKSIVQRYKRPIVGLKLCGPCKTLKYISSLFKIPHHPDERTLKESAQRGCTCCQLVLREFDVAMEHCSYLPATDQASSIERPQFLLWFAAHTRTKSGYLDALRVEKYYQYVLGQQPRPVQANPRSQKCLALVRDWLQTCDRDDQCYQGSEANLPTRVIDITKQEPYLLVTTQHRGKYIALSHCWGANKPLVTTLSTLSTRIQGIPVKTLPKMFQDVIFIARQLGIDYIWIDSLCIIQDSQVDWSREAAIMGDVYRFAYLTLSALDATGCEEGILLPRLEHSAVDVKAQRKVLGPSQDSIRSKRTVFKESVLCHRAWALQERLLSPRVLFYSKEEMLWECLACTAREGSTTVKNYRPSEYSYADFQCPDVKNRLIKFQKDDYSSPWVPSLDWDIIVAEYTRCNLTNTTDKLPALSGLASVYQANTGQTYLAGLWKEDLKNGLLWFAQPMPNQIKPPSQSEYLGPTWSWVSCAFPVLHIALTGSETSPESQASDMTLLSSKVIHKGTNRMGEILEASITVEAVSANLNLEISAIGDPSYITNEHGTQLGMFLPDSNCDKSSARKSCKGLLITHRTYMAHDYDRGQPSSWTILLWTYILVIVPDSTGTAWKRIGLGKTTKRDKIFNDLDTRTTFLLI